MGSGPVEISGAWYGDCPSCAKDRIVLHDENARFPVRQLLCDPVIHTIDVNRKKAEIFVEAAPFEERRDVILDDKGPLGVQVEFPEVVRGLQSFDKSVRPV